MISAGVGGLLHGTSFAAKVVHCFVRQVQPFDVIFTFRPQHWCRIERRDVYYQLVLSSMHSTTIQLVSSTRIPMLF